jgi:hypothetical protein
VILYVNGDSHGAGAELVQHRNGVLLEFDDDTQQYQPAQNSTKNLHLECVKRSYSQHLANHLGAELVCEAESGGSSARALRVTREYLKHNRPDLLVIGWSPFEREEWWHNGIAYQVTGGGVKSVPVELADRYKQWVIDNSTPSAINARAVALHQVIFDFHQELVDLKIPHVFFNTFDSFQYITDMGATKFDWGNHYVEPYQESYTYCSWLKNQNYQTVGPTSMHFGPAGHRAWADFLYQNYCNNALIR